MVIRADLHIHSCLSPCGDLEMSPRAIVARAIDAGLSGIAVTDHNTARHSAVMGQLCAENGLEVLYGMEVCSMEEAHVLCLFDDLAAVQDFDQFIYAHLPDIPSQPERTGDQVVVNANDEIEDEVERYLGGAAELTLDQLMVEVTQRKGLFIPAHVDKPLFSIPSQLGFLPAMDYDAIEVSWHRYRAGPLDPAFEQWPVITNSDAHYLDDIAKASTEYNLPELTVGALRQCLQDRQMQSHFS